MRNYKYGEEVNNKMIYSEEIRFCVQYLKERGILAKQYTDICKTLNKNARPEYKLVPINNSFYTELAENLRELWPPGDKEILVGGEVRRYPWRDSVDNLAKRLESLWISRFKGKEFTMEQCLTAARQYLNQFQNSVKYMQLLKYFILKQNDYTEPNGKIRYTYESKFADILESNATIDSWNETLENVTTTTPLDEGNLV